MSCKTRRSPHASHTKQTETTVANAIEVVETVLRRSATQCTNSDSTKEHSWQMASTSNPVDYKWKVFFRQICRKNLKFGQLPAIRSWIAHEWMICVSSLEKHIFIWANTGKTNNMPPRETKGCAQWCHTLQADLVPSGPNPASAEPTWCKPKITFFGHQLPRPPPIQHNQKWKRCTHFQMFFDHFFASE